MSLSIGIVGLPNVGKSTLFQAITKKQVDRQNYPFCTIDPNVGVVAVPDERVDLLVDLTKSEKKIYATVKFVDIAGLVKGASQGEGLGNKFLANIREVDSIVYVLRCFKNSNIINTRSGIDPVGDKEILDMELALKDLETAEKRLDGLESGVKAKDKQAIAEHKVISQAIEYLKSGKILAEQNWTVDEEKILSLYQFLTMKKRLYLLNGKEEEIPEGILEVFQKNKWDYVILDVLTEFDSSNMTEEERKEFGMTGDLRIDVLIKESYKLLDLITFLTTGADETRAWTIKRGWSAPQAAGVIHTDFERCFIRAEVVNWKDLLSSGGFVEARSKGLIRSEGKEYIVKDGDVIEIKANA